MKGRESRERPNKLSSVSGERTARGAKDRADSASACPFANGWWKREMERSRSIRPTRKALVSAFSLVLWRSLPTLRPNQSCRLEISKLYWRILIHIPSSKWSGLPDQFRLHLSHKGEAIPPLSAARSLIGTGGLFHDSSQIYRNDQAISKFPVRIHSSATEAERIIAA